MATRRPIVRLKTDPRSAFRIETGDYDPEGRYMCFDADGRPHGVAEGSDFELLDEERAKRALLVEDGLGGWIAYDEETGTFIGKIME